MLRYHAHSTSDVEEDFMISGGERSEKFVFDEDNFEELLDKLRVTREKVKSLPKSSFGGRSKLKGRSPMKKKSPARAQSQPEVRGGRLLRGRRSSRGRSPIRGESPRRGNLSLKGKSPAKGKSSAKGKSPVRGARLTNKGAGRKGRKSKKPQKGKKKPGKQSVDSVESYIFGETNISSEHCDGCTGSKRPICKHTFPDQPFTFSGINTEMDHRLHNFGTDMGQSVCDALPSYIKDMMETDELCDENMTQVEVKQKSRVEKQDNDIASIEEVDISMANTQEPAESAHSHVERKMTLKYNKLIMKRKHASPRSVPEQKKVYGTICRCCNPYMAKDVLTKWYEENIDHPYPTIAQMRNLAKQCGITEKQVSAWLTYKRSTAEARNIPRKSPRFL